jgi:hypothetical protein
VEQDPDTDRPADPDVDADSPSTLLGVVTPPVTYETAIRESLAAVQTEISNLRAQRTTDDREGLAEIAAKRAALIANRNRINADIKAKLAEQKRLNALVRVLDKQ